MGCKVSVSYFTFHECEPVPGTIEADKGELLGEDLAECAYCGEDITGNENGWRHIEEVF